MHKKRARSEEERSRVSLDGGGESARVGHGSVEHGRDMAVEDSVQRTWSASSTTASCIAVTGCSEGNAGGVCVAKKFGKSRGWEMKGGFRKRSYWSP